MTNIKFIDLFLSLDNSLQPYLKCNNLTIKNNVLYSYLEPIAVKLGNKIMITSKRFSQTTSRHCNDVIRRAYPNFITERIDHNQLKSLI